MNIKTKRRAVSALLCAVLTMIGAFTWLAACTDYVSAAVDLTRQKASSETATIKMGKTLTATQDNKFPQITDFTYTLERVKAWDSSNVSAQESGTEIAKQNIPMPSASSTASHSIAVSGDAATVSIGNFSGSDANDTATVRNRFTDVPIKYTKSGYYLYKIKESASVPASVPGVTYDSHEYFIAVYVANKMDDDGNTVDGVYVHSITAYRNESGSGTYQPDLSNIAKTTDNGGTAAVQNDEANLGKVGLSTAASPNILKADNMWNKYTTSDLVITNNVQGTLGDRSKEFEFDVVLSGLENAKAYQLAGDVSVDGVSVGTYDAQSKSITTSADGKATVRLKLKDDQQIRIEALNVTSKYTVAEAANDHIPSYAITAEGGGGAAIAKPSDQKTTDNIKLSTVEETVDMSDKDQTVAFQNKRDLATLTGHRTGMLGMMTLAGLLMLAGILVMAIRRAINGHA